MLNAVSNSIHHASFIELPFAGGVRVDFPTLENLLNAPWPSNGASGAYRQFMLAQSPQESDVYKACAQLLSIDRNFLKEVRTLVIYLKDPNSVYTACSEGLAKLMGCPRMHIIGQGDLKLWPLEDAEGYVAHDQEVMESGKPRFNLVEWVTPPRGPRLMVLSHKMPLRASDGSVIGTFGVTIVSNKVEVKITTISI